MENITLGQIVGAIGIISVISGVFIKVHKFMESAKEQREKQQEAIENILEQVNQLKESINQRIDDFEFNQIKSSLINYMCLAETVGLTEEQKKNAHELYDWYISHNGNSYVKERFEKLVKDGKI